jgi:ATP synthase protein I
MVRAPDTKRFDTKRSAPSVTDDLASRIQGARSERVKDVSETSRRPGEATRIGRGFRFAAEFVAAILVGAGIGYGIDLLLGTLPFGMIVMLLVGFAAGVLNVVRAARDMAAETPVPEQSAPVDDDED